MLAAAAGDFDIQNGNRWRPLADTAVAAQILYGAPDAFMLSRRSVDFYEASMFLWLNVDTELRRRSGGQVSLDDYVKRFYAGAGGQPALKPYVEADVYATLAGLVPADWRTIIRHHLDSLGPDALLAALKASGWQLTYSAQKNSYLETEQKRRKATLRYWSVGLLLNDKDEIVEALETGPAARAGAGPGMKLIAVNGRKYSAEVLDAAIAAAHADHKPIELMVENGDFFRVLSVSYFDGARWPHLTRVEGSSDALADVLKARAN
jgi:predicted metalloprotease with PDZ domain